MNNDLDDDVKDILAILQGNSEENIVAKKTEKKAVSVKSAKKDTPSSQNPDNNRGVSATKTEKKSVVTAKPKPQSAFLMEVDEPDDKSIFNSKVLIREEIYEIFMSLKRIKKFKSVSTLVDFALEEYIKTHREHIKQTLYDSKNHEIL